MTTELAEELARLAARLAVDAGDSAFAGRAESGVTAAATKSSATDMVTEFDKANEVLIVRGILAARPDDGIVGEEGTDRPGTTGVVWLIDPIDGTTNFLYGLAGWGVSIAAQFEGNGLAAAVYLPATRELFTAIAGSGAWCNGRPIRCGATSDISVALVGTGFSYQSERRALQAVRVASLLPQVRDIRRLGAAAADLCYVADGRLDVYFEEGLGPWDLAAGALIAAEAGCTLSSLDGGAVRPSSVLVSVPALHEPMQALLAACAVESC